MPLVFTKNEKQQTYTATDGDYRVECYKEVETWHYEVWLKGKKVAHDSKDRWWFLDAKIQAEQAMLLHRGDIVESTEAKS